MSLRSEHIKGLLLATCGALALTPDGLLVRLVEAPEWTIIFWRALFIAIGLVISQVLTSHFKDLKRLLPQSWREWLAATLSALGTLTFVVAINKTTVANALVILSTMSLFAALLSMIFLKERIPQRTWIAMCCAVIGIIIVFLDGLDGEGLDGKLIALTCAFLTAANMTVIRSEKSINVPTVFTWGGFLICLPALFFASTLNINFQAGYTLAVMGGLNAIAFVLLGLGAKHIPSPEVSLLMLLETILGPVWVWVILHEAPSLNAFLGGSIVVFTLAFHSLAGLRAHKKTSQPHVS